MIRFVRKPEFIYKSCRVKARKILQSDKNRLVQCNYCDKHFWKLFTFFITVLIKLLCCSCCSVFYVYVR